MLLGVDVGGTFTDFVWWDGLRFTTGKVPTTPDPAEGLLAGAGEVGGEVTDFIHGTTIATNTLLQRRGARTALVTTVGIGDVIEIGRQDRPSLYDAAADRPTPLVARDARLEFEGRALADATVLLPPRRLTDLAQAMAAIEPEAVAVALLYAYARPDHEREVAAAISAALPDVPVSLSSVVSPEFREYERTSTTVLNAYLTPAVSNYLHILSAKAGEAGLPSPQVLRSSGGVIDANGASRLPATILLSGPAGGAMAAAAIGEANGWDRLISFDMGGTSTDVCRIEDGKPQAAYERPVDGYPCRLPAVAINTVGAGGGSVGWIDPGGALRVGPQSAGAAPGPASYGLGGREPTVTDAHLLAGRLHPSSSLAGGLTLDPRAAETATAALAGPGLEADELPLGILSVVEETMARAIRRVTLEEGADPRGAVLVAFGGAGGLHASALARSLEMASVAVPANAGVFSALGLLLSPAKADASRSVVIDAADDDRLDREASAIARQAADDLDALAGTEPDATECLVDVRYAGQSHEIQVQYEPGDGWRTLSERFHALHTRRNGFARPEDPIEVVTFRATCTRRPLLAWSDLPPARPEAEPRRGVRQVLTDTGPVEASIWWRPGLRPGAEITGPAIVEAPESTINIGVGERGLVGDDGTLAIEW